MKREGRQHGMVRTYRILPAPLNPRPDTRFVNRFDSPATAGQFAQVSPRPTNHSKFTGKCGQPRCSGCHLSPACKARDKTKGSQKSRSNDVVSNYRLLTWRVVDVRPGLNFSGVSATRILDNLSRYHDYDDHDDHDEVDDDRAMDIEPAMQSRVEINNGEEHDDDDQIISRDYGDDHDEEEMGFCDVGFVVEQVEGDDGWCLVGEM